MAARLGVNACACHGVFCLPPDPVAAERAGALNERAGTLCAARGFRYNRRYFSATL